MVSIKLKAAELIANLGRKATRKSAARRAKFKEWAAMVHSHSVNSAPVGGKRGTAGDGVPEPKQKRGSSKLYRPPGGSLRRSASIAFEESASSIKATIGFNVPYAMLQHENVSGVEIKPRAGHYLFLPKTRRGYMAWVKKNWTGVKMFRDYILPGFPGPAKSVHLKPQPRAKFLSRHIEAGKRLLARWLS